MTINKRHSMIYRHGEKSSLGFISFKPSHHIVVGGGCFKRVEVVGFRVFRACGIQSVYRN